MINIFDLIASFIGGIFVGNISKLSIVIRLIVYFIILAFFEIFYYLNISNEEEANDSDDYVTIYFIASGILTGFIFLIKFTLWILNIIIKFPIELSDSIDSKIEERPDNIPPDIWQLRDTVINSKRPQDLVISDLLASGIDPTGLMNLVNYIQNNDQISEISISKQEDSEDYAINLFGKLYYTKLNPTNINKIFPSTSSFLVIFCSTLLCFSATYFSLSVKNNFLPREKWWVAIVCTISIYSILYPVDSDPYSTRIPDQWTGCSRPLALFIIAGLWRLIICLDEKYTQQKKIFIISFFYDISIKWEYISPYLNDILHYSMIFLPFLVFIGLIGHPISTIVSIIESFNRYFFGQNGVSNILHLIIQLIRGAASVAINWALLQHKFNGPTLAISVAISTFLGTFPVITNMKRNCSLIIYFCYPFLTSAISFLISFCLVDLVGNRWDIISWLSFAWILLADIVFPYIYSNEKYFFFHFRLLNSFYGSIFIRNITQVLITPLFVTSALHYQNKYIHQNYDTIDLDATKGYHNKTRSFSTQKPIDFFYTSSNLPKLIISCAIVHGIQKAYTEPHYFAFVVWLTVLTFPYEFDLQFPAVNFIISLLLVAKLEIFIPQAEFALRSRNSSFFFRNEESKPFFLISIVIQLLNKFYQMTPMGDFVLKIPCLIWSFFTGASFISIKGLSTFLTFSPLRPTYFFDWPSHDDQDLEAIFTKKVNEYPIEAPVYTSVSYSLSSKLATIIRSGRLGLVSNGDIFLMQEGTSLLTVFVHIIAIEPYCIKMQIRGLEYMDRTLCHAEEDLFLYEMINDYQRFPNFTASTISSCSVYDIRALKLPLKMYENSKTNVKEAFVGLEPLLNVKIMLASYCHTFNSIFSLQKINVRTDIQPLPTEIADSKEAALFNNRENLDDLTELIRGNCTVNEEEIDLLFGLFITICLNVLDETGKFLNDHVVDFFNGKIEFKGEFSWIYNFPLIYSDFILPTVRKGIVSGFLASSGFLNEDENIEEVANFIDEVCQTYTITTLNSPVFRSTFIGEDIKSDYSQKGEPTPSSSSSSSISSISKDEDAAENLEKNKFDKRKKIIVLAKVNDEDVVLRFSKNKVKWNVLKVKHEWVRALWGNDTMDILFYRNTNAERMSIQYNKLYLNNMILQACDSPIGYPAFVSKIMDSYIHPCSLKKF